MIMMVMHKFCSLLIIGVLLSASSEAQVCPAPAEETFGACIESCTSNSDCNDGQLCCSNGCGRQCMEDLCTTVRCAAPNCSDDAAGTITPEGQCCPVCACSTTDSSMVAAGTSFMNDCNTCFCGSTGVAGCTFIACPPTTEPTTATPTTDANTLPTSSPTACPAPGNSIGTCIESCTSDSNCTGGQLCCSNGCGRQCMSPVEDPCATVGCAAPNCSDLAAGTITPEGQCCPVCACATTDGSMVAAGTSFMNDCNTCNCGSTGVAGCTRLACPPTTEPTTATPTTDANTLPTSSPTACPVGGQIRVGCASACNTTCANMDSLLICPQVCIINGCQCPSGTVIDEQSNTCVAHSDCPTAACPVEGQVRIPCASPCGVTCANMDTALICPTVCVTNGCQCPSGMVIDEQSNTCVARSDCPSTGRTKTCPTVQSTNEDNCVDECSSHGDCQYDRICCSNGCGGHTCSDSVEMCQLIQCDWPRCENGTRPVTSPFSCCPYCPTTPPPRPSGCTASDGTSVGVGETYMDQCNTCRCLEGGVGACTKMACVGCTLADGSWVAIGDTYKKDCNTCTCTDQDVDICTEIACVKSGGQDTLDGAAGSGNTLFAGLITTLLCGLLSVFL